MFYIDDRVLALCEISNDPLFHKIPKNSLSYYVDNSLEEGYNAAKEFIGINIEALFEKKKIPIEYKDDGKGSFGMAYRGQITLSKDNCSLIVFRSSIQELAKNSKNNEYPPIDYEQAKNIHLAHEFFHLLEYEDNRFISNTLKPIIAFQIFGVKRLAHINRCSEVAAHAFAKTLLNIPVLPNYYDYLYLINTGSLKHDELKIKFDKFKHLLESV